MKADIACIPCVLNFCLRTLDFCNLNSSQKEEIFKKIIGRIGDFPLEKTPAALADFAINIIKEETDIEDPYRDEKRRQNQSALNFYPLLKEIVKDSKDRLKTALKVSAAGNVIDLGAHGDSYNLETILQSFENIVFTKDDSGDFITKLGKSKTLLFIADNCGEIIFDRILLEELKNIKKIVAVKSGPFINDVTVQDIKDTGIDKTVKIIETGTSTPDFDEGKIGEEFLKNFKTVDIIISKGHANFEALHKKREDIFFLLRGKCDVVAKVLNVRKGDFVFKKF